jgi:hypothetical protein
MPTTSNFGWTTPADTDLVKDGAAAIRTLGNGIDTSLVDLKGGTTGQVLSKNSNTDLDFTWVAQDDSNAIQNALLTTTGDTIYASAASTPARLGIGTSGQVLTVAGGVPSWATPAGGMTLIQETVASSNTSITFGSIPATYGELYLVWHGIYPSNSTTSFGIRFNNNSSANTYKGTLWQDANSSGVDDTAVVGTDNNKNIFPFTSGTSANLINNSMGFLRIPNYASSSKYKRYQIQWAGTSATLGGFGFNFLGTFLSTTAISSIDIVRLSGTGNITNASDTSIRLYGI